MVDRVDDEGTADSGSVGHCEIAGRTSKAAGRVTVDRFTVDNSTSREEGCTRVARRTIAALEADRLLAAQTSDGDHNPTGEARNEYRHLDLKSSYATVLDDNELGIEHGSRNKGRTGAAELDRATTPRAKLHQARNAWY